MESHTQPTETEPETEARTIDYRAAFENSRARRRNTSISYEIDVTVPAEHWPEEFEDQQRLIHMIVSDYHREQFGAAGVGFNPGISSITNFGDTVTVYAVVSA